MSGCDCGAGGGHGDQGHGGEGKASRRDFLRSAGLTLLVSAIDLRLLRAGSPMPGLEKLAKGTGSGKTLIFIFQRFGADGLNIVVPVNDAEYAVYRSFRPNLAIDRTHPLIGPLTQDFALNPVMKNGIHRLWQQGTVAVLPNVGYPNASRSHFDSQLYLDRGTPDNRTTRDGWLNRYLLSSTGSPDPLRALAFGSSMPAALEGTAPALVMKDVGSLSVSPDNPARNDKFFDLQRQAYGEPPAGRTYDAEIANIGKSLIDGIRSIPPTLPAPTVAYPAGAFGNSMKQLAQLIRSDLFSIEVAEVDFGGWDTHGKQQVDVTSGTFPSLLSQFSDGIAALVDDLGPARMQDIVILTASEFGRTARENGSLGTDHGSAWASFAIGGRVRGGMYFGQDGWQGLTDLRDDRDLKHSLDFRDVFSEVLSRHLGTLDASVFPGWNYQAINFLT